MLTLFAATLETATPGANAVGIFIYRRILDPEVHSAKLRCGVCGSVKERTPAFVYKNGSRYSTSFRETVLLRPIGICVLV